MAFVVCSLFLGAPLVLATSGGEGWSLEAGTPWILETTRVVVWWDVGSELVEWGRKGEPVAYSFFVSPPLRSWLAPLRPLLPVHQSPFLLLFFLCHYHFIGIANAFVGSMGTLLRVLRAGPAG